MKESSLLPLLVGGALTVAALATLLIKGGWLIWVPVFLALLVVCRMGGTPDR